MNKLQALIVSGLTLCVHSGALAQAREMTLQEILVTANRNASALVSPARQVVVLDREETRLRMLAGGTLAELLSSTVPGLAPASQTPSEFALNLRGRGFLTLIDGIPLAPSRNVSRNLPNLHPNEISSIEVISGGNALYGSGATGGIVSISTLQPTREHQQSSSLEGSSSLSNPGGDSLGVQFTQAFTGSFDAFDYVLSLTRSESGANYDADGDRIAPEVSQGDSFEAQTSSVVAKLGRNLGDERRMQVSVNLFDREQDTDFASDTSVLNEPLRSVDARAVPGLRLDKQNEFQNRLANLEYFDGDIIGSALHTQLYYREHETRFYPFDARALATWRHLVQTQLQNEVFGGRLTMNTPMSQFATNDSEFVWGLDVNLDKSEAPVTVYDGELFDASGGLVFSDRGEKVHMPLIETETQAVFAQYRTRLGEHWSWDLGARFETVEVSFEEFVPLAQTLEEDPFRIPAGKLNYEEWIFNAALVFNPVTEHEFYVAFNQGFDQADIGLQVRNAQPGFDINGANLEAIIIDSYELGWRGDWQDLSASLALFHNSSDLGGVSTADFGLSLLRTEERVQGVEASLDYSFSNRWAGGLSAAWLEGEEKPAGSDYRSMQGFRTPPLQLSAFLAFNPLSNWHNRFQAYYVGSEDYRLDGVASFGRRTMESYWTADLISRFELASGSVRLAVENLFNNDYKTLYGQLLRSSSNQSHIPARGATLRLAYTHEW